MKFEELGTKAMRTVNVIGQGFSPDPADMDVAFQACNDMIDAWAAKRLTVFQTLRKLFDLVPNKGSVINPYTIGPGGDFDVARPTWIPNAMLVVYTTTPPFEMALTVLTPDEYAGISIKDLASALANTLYFDGKFDTSGADVGLGNIFLYPVPNGQQPVKLALYLPIPMRGFADISTTDYTFPPGYAEALRYQLAMRLAAEFQKPVSPAIAQLARDSFAVIESANVPIPTLRCDWGIVGTNAASSLYNWRTGSSSRRGGAT